jgi:hypothetical protein
MCCLKVALVVSTEDVVVAGGRRRIGLQSVYPYLGRSFADLQTAIGKVPKSGSSLELDPAK